MKTIAFYGRHLGLRGTEVSMYDYAHFNEEILKNESIIIYPHDSPYNDETVIKKFKNRFDKIFTISIADETKVIEQIDEILLKNNCTHFYTQKMGLNDGIYTKVCKSLILCCASCFNPWKEKHGDRYAFISYWLSKHCSNSEFPVVPYIVDLPNIDDNLRTELNIPQNAIVFARNGGLDSWDIPWVNDVIIQCLKENELIYFLFQNTPNFYTHPRIIHVPPTADLNFKTKFINTSDALLHARHTGESFGLTCAEFSIRNKRVITFQGSPERNHIDILADKALYYNNPSELLDILLNFEPDNSIDWNCYKNYTPEKVMNIFDKVFLN